MRAPFLALAAAAAVATAAPPASAVAAAHWSNAKCSSAFTHWYDRHFSPSSALSPAQVREVRAHVKTIERQHHCRIG